MQEEPAKDDSKEATSGGTTPAEGATSTGAKPVGEAATEKKAEPKKEA
jgi:hypothetical protein